MTLNIHLARRAAGVMASCAVGVAMLSGCVTTVHGTANYAAGPPIASTSQSADPQSEMQKQCAVALTTAKGFIDNWKQLAASPVAPTDDQRAQLAAEISGYVDQLNAQLPGIADSQLVSLLQIVVAEMQKIVEGLTTGVQVDLSSYATAVNNTATYCQ